MKSSFLNLALLAPAVAAGVLANGLSAQAITLNAGDVLNLASEVEITLGGFGFEFTPPSGASTGSNFVVTGATGGFSPFADPLFANGPLPNPPNEYVVTNLDFTTFVQTGSVIPFDDLNNITNAKYAPGP